MKEEALDRTMWRNRFRGGLDLSSDRILNEKSVPITKYYSCNQTKKNEMGSECGMYGGQVKCIQGFGGGDLRERGHLEVLVVDGSVVLKWIFNKWDEGMDWIDLDQDRDRWRAIVNAVMNLRVP